MRNLDYLLGEDYLSLKNQSHFIKLMSYYLHGAYNGSSIDPKDLKYQDLAENFNPHIEDILFKKGSFGKGVTLINRADFIPLLFNDSSMSHLKRCLIWSITNLNDFITNSSEITHRERIVMKRYYEDGMKSIQSTPLTDLSLNELYTLKIKLNTPLIYSTKWWNHYE